MTWIIIIFSFLVVLLINGMIQQERFRLLQLRQAELAERRTAEIEEQKKQAAGKIKSMLAEKRSLLSAQSKQAGETGDAAAEPGAQADLGQEQGQPVAAKQ
jgi:uncharacterized membrane protein YcjF (UPF0283 family)